MSNLTEALRKSGLDEKYWLPQFKKMGVTSEEELCRIEEDEEAFYTLQKNAKCDRDKEALQKLLKIVVPTDKQEEKAKQEVSSWWSPLRKAGHLSGVDTHKCKAKVAEKQHKKAEQEMGSQWPQPTGHLPEVHTLKCEAKGQQAEEQHKKAEQEVKGKMDPQFKKIEHLPPPGKGISLQNLLSTVGAKQSTSKPGYKISMIESNPEAHTLFSNLGLTEYYQKKLGLQDALCIRSEPLETSLKMSHPTELK